MDRNVKVGAKRPRSPCEGACGWCFRTSHATSECRHQVVCLRCSGVGHVAARCPVEDRRSLRRRRLHVRSKLARSKADSPGLGKNVEDNLDGVSVTQKVQSGGTKQVGNHASLSLSLSPESYELREELAKVTVLSLVRGNVNEGSVLEVMPSVIATKIAGPIVPLNESSFLIPFENRNKMREVVKLGTFDVMIKDGKCTVNLAHWMAELGALGRADGDGQ